MLSFRVFAKLHPRRPFLARRSTLPVNVLTDRCPRTIEAPVMERISRQPRASRGVGLVLLQDLSLPRGVLTSLRCFLFSKSFICNIYTPPHKSVANKRLTRSLNPLDATFTRNRGVGGCNPGIPEDLLYLGPYSATKKGFAPPEATSGGGRPERRRCPCGEAHPGNTSCGERPTPRCLRGFLFSAK